MYTVYEIFDGPRVLPNGQVYFAYAGWESLRQKRQGRGGVETITPAGHRLRAPLVNDHKAQIPTSGDWTPRVTEAIEGFLARASNKRWHGDRRGTTLNLQVGAGGDDGGTIGGSFSSSRSTDRLGNPSPSICHCFFRFAGVSGLSGVTVDSATLKPYISFAEQTITTAAYCNAAESPVAPTTGSQFNALALTTANAPRTGAFTIGQRNDYDITAPAQEIADTYDPTAILVVVKDAGSSPGGYANITSYNGNPSLSCQLDIDYTEGGGIVPVIQRHRRNQGMI